MPRVTADLQPFFLWINLPVDCPTQSGPQYSPRGMMSVIDSMTVSAPRSE